MKDVLNILRFSEKQSCKWTVVGSKTTQNVTKLNFKKLLAIYPYELKVERIMNKSRSKCFRKAIKFINNKIRFVIDTENRYTASKHEIYSYEIYYEKNCCLTNLTILTKIKAH